MLNFTPYVPYFTPIQSFGLENIKISNDLYKVRDSVRILREELEASLATAREQTEIISLRSRITDLTSSLTTINHRLDSLQTRNNIVIDSLRFLNFNSISQKTTLELDVVDKQLKVIEDTSDFQDQKIKALSDSFEKKQLFEDFILTQDDKKSFFKNYSLMTITVNNLAEKGKELKPLISKTRTEFNILKKQAEKISTILSLGIKSNLFTEIYNLTDSLNKSITQFNKTCDLLKQKLKEKSDLLSNSLKIVEDKEKEIKAIFVKFQKEGKDDSGDLKAIANFIQPIGEEGKLVPEITVLAFKQFSDPKKTFAYNIRLFVAPSETKSTLNSEYRLFIPEASTYGIMADFSLGFITVEDKDQDKKLAINWGAYYLGKSIVKSDKSSFSFGMLQFKAGLQYILIKHTLSIYANLNPYFISNGLSEFKNTYSSFKNKLNSFTDFGVNSYLNLSKKQEDFFLNLDLGFISNSGDVKTIVTSDDPLLPRIKVGLVKSFNF